MDEIANIEVTEDINIPDPELAKVDSPKAQMSSQVEQIQQDSKSSPSKSGNGNTVHFASIDTKASLGKSPKAREKRKPKFSQTLDRFKAYENKRVQKLEKNREVWNQSVEINIRARPEINAKSEQMANSKVPLFERLETYITEKNESLQELRDKAKESRELSEMEEVTFKPAIIKKKSQSKIRRSPSKFYSEQMQWQNEIGNKTRITRTQQIEKSKEELRDRPNINEKTKNLAQKKKKKPLYIRVDEVILEHHAKSELIKEQFTPTFEAKSLSTRNASASPPRKYFGHSPRVLKSDLIKPEKSVILKRMGSKSVRNSSYSGNRKQFYDSPLLSTLDSIKASKESTETIKHQNSVDFVKQLFGGKK